MRKSRTVSTLLLAGAAAGLAGCGDPPEEVRMFSSIEACKVELTPSECETAFAAAKTEHQATAPRFADQAACEAEFGADACQKVDQPAATPAPEGQTAAASPSIGSYFMPFMMGYMVSNAMNSFGSRYARPVYVDRQGYVRSGDRTVSRFQGGLPPGGLAGKQWSSSATVDRAAMRTPTAPARPSLGAPSGRSYGGFGGTGSRAGYSGGS